ncbi:5772_t:CDS:1 [Dentiscutata heterogama]|uniref:5772_t:CDS:1 n=1 Tax=Dentiscutata heterogama TaxID=1316150 RepID=A0ACA9LWQ7_9GLOM|nr:5772_t:CDS:1 [Dentiscutata heterogama]
MLNLKYNLNLFSLSKNSQVTIVKKEIIDISIELFWNTNDLSATFVEPLEFTTVLNYGCTTIKNLDEPDTILLNRNSYKKITNSDIHDLISSINNVFLEEVITLIAITDNDIDD